MTLNYQSTRNSNQRVSASQAILQGLSVDGGLFVPTELPSLAFDFKAMSQMSYQEVAYIVMKEFLTDFSEGELKACINQAYDEKFTDPSIAPLKKVGEDYYLELFHGSTIAFKDLALALLPYLMVTAAKKNNLEDEIVILTATSGDTGKAAMAGFADVPGTKIIVFYPKNGVSGIQEQQMLTQKGQNTSVVGITGNFDDAQTKVKEMFNNSLLNQQLKENQKQFSSANSINIGRLIPQIVYYVYAYAQLVGRGRIKAGEEINFSVPTGNFGNILAGYYAKELGVPIKKLICASNENNVLTDFFNKGIYDRNREFKLTSSPSMDILVSSNLERLIFHVTGNDSQACQGLMNQLDTKGVYEITPKMQAKLATFVAGYASEEVVSQRIEKVFNESNYVIDPHTAVADAVKEEQGLAGVTVVVSTASPYKFPQAVVNSLSQEFQELEDDFQLVDQLQLLSQVPIPAAVTEVRGADIRHDLVVETADMQRAVESLLKLK